MATTIPAAAYAKPGETILVLYAHLEPLWQRLHIDHASHSISTGDWKVSLNKIPPGSRVLLMHRSSIRTALYLGTIDVAVLGADEGTARIQLVHVQYVGSTNLNWQEFVGRGRRPERYVTGETDC